MWLFGGGYRKPSYTLAKDIFPPMQLDLFVLLIGKPGLLEELSCFSTHGPSGPFLASDGAIARGFPAWLASSAYIHESLNWHLQPLLSFPKRF